jgi:hypothetical protein
MEYDEWGNKINNDVDIVKLEAELNLSPEIMSDIHLRVNFLVAEGYIDWHRRDEAMEKLMRTLAKEGI